MKSTDIEYIPIIKERRSYFYGANTESGFKNTPDATLDEKECSRKILIKGGPGTGKSTIMKSFSDDASALGYDVTEYYCSSDPDSLDAVKVERDGARYVVCDATAPHAKEAGYPGAISEIFDLSPYWRKKTLEASRDRIVSLSDEKRKCFASCYAYLAAANEVSSLMKGITAEVCDGEKIDAFCRRNAAKFKTGGEERREYTSALTMKGAVSLRPIATRNVFVIDDSFGAASFLLSSLISALKSRRVGYEASVCPYDSTQIESVHIPAEGLVYTLIPQDDAEKTVRCERFLKKNASGVRARYRFLSKCRKALIDEALASLSAASRPHFELEKIYKRSMNFKSVTKAAYSRIISIL